MTELTCNVLLLVATQEERNQLGLAAESLGVAFDVRNSALLGEYYDLGTIGADRVLAVRSRMGPLDFGGSASKALLFQTRTGATSFISLGMSFGINDSTQAIGDVLVSTALIPYDTRDVVSVDGQPCYTYPRMRPRSASRSMVQLFRRVSGSFRPRQRVHFGALLSGGSIIRCRKYRETLVNSFLDTGHVIVGGEMEGVGLLSISSPDAPSWVIVKGICDFADENRDNIISEARPVACRNAALFVLRSLQAAAPSSS